MNWLKDKPVATTPEEEVILSARKLLDDSCQEFVEGFPVWMKCNVILNSLSLSERWERGEDAEYVNSIIAWDEINTFLRKGSVEYDYNLFGEISSLEELADLRDEAVCSSMDEYMPCYKQVCKQCGEEFVLSRKEIDWYLKKNLKVPHRCEYCRKGTKRSEPPKPVEKVEEEPIKTAMQLALEAAGITL